MSNPLTPRDIFSWHCLEAGISLFLIYTLKFFSCPFLETTLSRKYTAGLHARLFKINQKCCAPTKAVCSTHWHSQYLNKVVSLCDSCKQGFKQFLLFPEKTDLRLLFPLQEVSCRNSVEEKRRKLIVDVF